MIANTKRGGSRPGSGRPRKPATLRYGEVWVRLSEVHAVGIKLHVFATEHFDDGDKAAAWFVDGKKYHDYAAAAAEFVRRVNGTK